MNEEKTMKTIRALLALILISTLGAVTSAIADDHKTYLFNNVAVWDGFAEALQPGMNVLVEGNKVTQISADPGAVP